jgi:piezo-type mechanosensitive ion channel component 1/2
MAIVFNFVMNANLISLFIVLMVFGYSILENPIATSRFWKFFMTYMLTVISLKFLYQLPIFCGTPVYTFYSDKCNNEDLIPQVLANRIDYIIGIHKFSGPTSYPRNEGVFRGIIADVLLLMVLLLHKQYLSKIGAWNYVKNEQNIY